MKEEEEVESQARQLLSEEEHDNKSKNTFISSAVVANEMVSYLKHISY